MVVFISLINLSHNNMQNSGSRILRSIQDGTFFFDSMQNNHDYVKNLERFRIKEKIKEYCLHMSWELSIGSRAIRPPQPCSRIFHQHYHKMAQDQSHVFCIEKNL